MSKMKMLSPRLMFIASALVLSASACAGTTTGVMDSPAATAPESTPTPVVVQRETVTVKGKGIGKSKPFKLAGAYLVQWIATPSSSVGCYHGASLKRVDGTFLFETLVNELLNSKKPAEGETNLYDLDEADYFVDASSGCSWTFTFVPN